MAETGVDQGRHADGGRDHWRRRPATLMRRRVFGHFGLMLGGTILLVIVLMALLAGFISPHDPYDQQLARKLIPPFWHAAAPKVTWAHPLGTDHLGRDYLSRLLPRRPGLAADRLLGDDHLRADRHRGRRARRLFRRPGRHGR